ncbi:hypothetical protein [Chitinophaga sp. CF418]|uniref:hypothetical protein n=1 Tax=Chitinophaga sp. CF418 TaxID=1855287 RepID=UPI00165FBB7E|nr:hypothetical protein [Chitinophaga sp. CF418]
MKKLIPEFVIIGKIVSSLHRQNKNTNNIMLRIQLHSKPESFYCQIDGNSACGACYATE